MLLLHFYCGSLAMDFMNRHYGGKEGGPTAAVAAANGGGQPKCDDAASASAPSRSSPLLATAPHCSSLLLTATLLNQPALVRRACRIGADVNAARATDRADTALHIAARGGQWHALTACYGRHRRPVARSNWLLWPTPQG